MPTSRLIRPSWLRSASSAAPAPGYCTLTATSRPSAHVARCTWPMDAAAAGLSSNVVKRSRQSAPSSLGEYGVHGARRQRRRGLLQPGQGLAIGTGEVLGQRRLEHRHRLAELHRPALELAEHAEELLGGAGLHLGGDQLGRAAAQPPAQAPGGPPGVAQREARELGRAGHRAAGKVTHAAIVACRDAGGRHSRGSVTRPAAPAERVARPGTAAHPPVHAGDLERAVDGRQPVARGRFAVSVEERQHLQRRMRRHRGGEHHVAGRGDLARGAGQLGGDARPGRVAIGAMQVVAALAGGLPRQHQGPDDAGALAHGGEQVRDAAAYEPVGEPRVDRADDREHGDVGSLRHAQPWAAPTARRGALPAAPRPAGALPRRRSRCRPAPHRRAGSAHRRRLRAQPPRRLPAA